VIADNENNRYQDELWQRSSEMVSTMITDVCYRYLHYIGQRKVKSAVFASEMREQFIEDARREFFVGMSLKNPTWQAQLTAKVYDFLQERPYADDPQAFFLFRLTDWRDELAAALERSWNFWQERKDYDEFLRLVRPYLAVSSEDKVLQLMFCGGEWCFYDSFGKKLSLAELEAGAGWELADMLGLEHDESLIRILLNYAPAKLLLHLGPGELPPLGNLVSDLLGSRLVCCSGCEFCRRKHQPPLSI